MREFITALSTMKKYITALNTMLLLLFISLSKIVQSNNILAYMIIYMIHYMINNLLLIDNTLMGKIEISYINKSGYVETITDTFFILLSNMVSNLTACSLIPNEGVSESSVTLALTILTVNAVVGILYVVMHLILLAITHNKL